MRRLLLLLLATMLSLRASPADAQLISPGRLASAHAALEGIRQCTQCHQLGQRGVSATLCLGCHEPLAARVRAERGYHATTGNDCASCHKDHFGADFELVRLDTARFDHRSTGYPLDGAHRNVECGECHAPSRVADPAVRALVARSGGSSTTFLGLPTECASCHRDPHAGEFAGRACSSCHETAAWNRSPGFDHASTRYPLTGKHLGVECASCHADSLSFRPVAADRCTSCHADEHKGAMPGRCESCHSTTGWSGVDRTAVERRFDHRSTGFVLAGRHAQTACASCHVAETSAKVAGIRMAYVRSTARQPYPRPQVSDCRSCHVDAHAGELASVPGGANCVSCHGEETWLPAHYDLARHDREAGFLLEGAHRAVACADCHRSATDSLVLRPPAESCASCHAADDPHGTQFAGRACSSCHTSESFQRVRIDHAQTRFPLDGSHAGVPCASCHGTEPDADGRAMVRYRPLGVQCRDCHAESK